jgi:lysophospholipase L1-like esterase
LATPARIVIALDGALTAGVRDVANSPTRWPRLLAERILEELDTTQLLVSEPDLGTVSRPLDLGRELGSLPPGALSQGGAKYVIVLPDIANEATAAQLIARQRHAIEQAHALGLKVFGGTVPAFEGTRLPNHTPVTETTRETVNDWIRRSGAYDGVIDFDLATSDPLHPARLLPAYDGGDHLHPNQAGYRAMADAIDLSLFED